MPCCANCNREVEAGVLTGYAARIRQTDEDDRLIRDYAFDGMVCPECIPRMKHSTASILERACTRPNWDGPA